MSEFKQTIVIAGASGFIGRWFIELLSEKYRIIAISRSDVENDPDSQIEWRKADLYSLSSTKAALQGADIALYLVHSMEPSSRMNQSSFEDTDLLLADNFSRAAKHCNLRQIIYMGGILPKDKNEYSAHLKSRYETELTLSSRGTPVTALRAGIIIGPGGSSFEIIENLIKHLPVMACPQWCNSISQPIDVRDVINIMDRCIANPKTYNKSLEIGGSERISYTNILRKTAHMMKQKRWIFEIPFFTLSFSKRWVSLFAKTSITLVSPLIESLKHDMTITEGEESFFDIDYISLDKSIEFGLNGEVPVIKKKYAANQKKLNTVRSVQRLPNPSKRSVIWVANLYPKWLTKKLRIGFRADVKGDMIYFRLLGVLLLQLQFITEHSDDDRQLFFIVGGVLVKRTDFGWLEFRSVLNNDYVIAAIHEFIPALPWIIYKYSQAIVHLWVMNAYGKFLKNQPIQ